MAQFRPQKSSLKESMLEVGMFDTRCKLAEHLNAWAERVDVIKYCFDDRNNWDTYIVTVDGQAVGFTDGPLD